MTELYRAALELIRAADIARTLARVGRITTADQMAVSQASHRYDRARRT